MVDARWARMIIEGDMVSGPFAGEIWQTGLSFVTGDAGGIFPGGIKEPLPTFSVNTMGEHTSDATWEKDWAWEGSTKMTKACQTSLADLALTFWNAIKGSAPTQSRMLGVRINAHQADGKVVNGANVFSLKTPALGTASSPMPNQLAIVASLRTGARGPGGRGRMFLPLNGTMAAGGVIAAATKTAINSGLLALIANAYDLAAGNPLASIVNAKGLTYSSIASVGVGDLFDTQRRRRNAIQENYTVVQVVH